ncbi:histidinol dehydrogenase [Pseudolysinimonas sp.]|uniref:histidinol dehydrogenase n=1 Tax=Pseudolysinimonas sp. TaxID=2680009 RepID=UPI00286B7DE5|nr:histidinol dehydrogenase [Pseudolysinimonas sp.]
MIQSIDLRGRRPTPSELRALVHRAEVDVSAAIPVAADLIRDVRERGTTALDEQADRFDGGRAAAIRVDPASIAAAVTRLPQQIRAALDEVIDRERAASRAQVPAPAVTTVAPGAQITQRWQPVDRVGLYIPGGKAVYPSSVVMNVVPAQVAGVGSIALASPPQKDFEHGIHPLILGAAGVLGVDEVYAMGGAGAIGALAYGIPSLALDPVDVVAGPGNVYVAAAKRVVQGDVGIDAEAGPSEVLVIADADADPVVVAADLISQAEHDESAAAVLVTDSAELADAVRAELERQVAQTAARERVLVALAGPQSAIVLVDDLDTAARVSDAYAPEHLEIQTADPGAVLDRISHAGAIFLGTYSPVSLGDYLAGSNHILPTGGTARFASGISAVTFLRPQQVVHYDTDALRTVAHHIRTMSDAEHLPAHGDAVDARFRGD